MRDWQLSDTDKICQTHALRSQHVAYRPLPAELLQYAQADVHYLCFLAGRLCAMLAAKGAGCLQEAKKRSLEMCLALYSKPASEVRTTCTSLHRGFRPCAMQHANVLWQWQCATMSLRIEFPGCKAHHVVHAHLARLHILLSHETHKVLA